MKLKMAFKIERFNVLAFEPENTSPNIKIAGDILSALECKVNSPFTKVVMPALAKSGFIPQSMTLAELAAFSQHEEIPEGIAKLIPIPEEERFYLNTASYKSRGGPEKNLKRGVPKTMSDFEDMYRATQKFKDVYGTIQDEEIQLVFFNTASTEQDNYRTLAQEIKDGKFPALDKATWIVTNAAMQYPMPSEFRQEVIKRGKTNGRTEQEMTRLFGSSYLADAGDSIALRTAKDCIETMHKRLKYIREMGQLAYPVDSSSNGVKNGTSTRTKI